MKSRFSPQLLRQGSICMLAVMLSLIVGSLIKRHQNSVPASQVPTSAQKSISTPSPDAPFSVEQFRAAVQSGTYLIIDVRDDIPYNQGHVPGALSLPYRRFDAVYAQLKTKLENNRAIRIILYCSGLDCDDSHRAEERLYQLGYLDVTVFPEGWNGWRESGGTEEKSGTATVQLMPWKKTP